jgi:site-specific recombinase XerD
MVTTPLRKKMLERMRIRNYSERTIETYIAAVARFAKHFHRSPDVLGAAEVEVFQLHLRDVAKVSWSSFNQIASALRFFYREVLDRSDVAARIPYGRRERRLPVVLSREELVRFFGAVDDFRYLVLLLVIYSAGLRVGEAVRLRPSDIDSSRMLIRVRQAKGKKDRYVPLSPHVLELLRDYYRHTPPPHEFLFSAKRDPRQHISEECVQKYVCRLSRRARLGKTVSTHTLRHCFATHLIEQGTSTRVIQVLLGHSSSKTTETYTHVSPQTLTRACSPLDQIVSLFSPSR